jgi:aryl-alcohol dehydrogenase-like predicted oxidoreductase
MEYRPLGRTGIQVSALGLGTNQFGNTCDEAQTKAIVDRAVGLGVNFIDTADTYARGASEELLGRALRGRRDDVVVATKTGAPAGGEAGKLSRRRIVQRLESSLKRLGMDHVDIYYLHFPDPATPLEESVRAIDDLIRAGKVRYLAVSNHPAWQVAAMVGLAKAGGWCAPIASQVQYNLIDRAIEAEMVPACSHFGISVVPYAPLYGGFLTGKYPRNVKPDASTRFGRPTPGFGVGVLKEARNFDKLERYEAFSNAHGHAVGELAVAWLLAQPIVCSVIAGATAPEQVSANAEASSWKLSPEDLGELA